MTFLKEEEVFPIVTDSDASKIVEDSSKSSVSATSVKEETTEANNTSVVADGKRKHSDKPEEKKVSAAICSSYLYKWLHPTYFFSSLLLSLRNEYLFWEINDISIDLILFQEANKPPDSWFELKVNTHVYVTGLPEDVTIDEVSINFCFTLPETTYIPCKN